MSPKWSIHTPGLRAKYLSLGYKCNPYLCSLQLLFCNNRRVIHVTLGQNVVVLSIANIKWIHNHLTTRLWEWVWYAVKGIRIWLLMYWCWYREFGCSILVWLLSRLQHGLGIVRHTSWDLEVAQYLALLQECGLKFAAQFPSTQKLLNDFNLL